MTIDGTYQLVLQTPMGVQQAKLTLVTKGAALSGALYAMGGRHPFSGGEVRGENCTFTTVLQTSFGRINLSVRGTVRDGHFKAAAATPFGTITAAGKRVEPAQK